MTKVRIALSSSTMNFLPIYVADKQGLFKKWNLDPAITTTAGGATALRGLHAGDFDFAAVLPEEPVNSIDNGSPMKIICSINDKDVYSFFVTPDINSVKDLKGQKVGILSQGNGTDYQVRTLLAANGIDPDKDATLVAVGGNAERLAALKSGQVKGTVFSPPTDQQAAAAGLKKLLNMKEVIPHYNHEVMAVPQKLIDTQPAVIKGIVNAIADAIDRINANQAEALKIGTETLNAKPDAAKAAFDVVLPTFPKGARMDKEGLQWSLDAVAKFSGLKKKLTVNDIADFSFTD